MLIDYFLYGIPVISVISIIIGIVLLSVKKALKFARILTLVSSILLLIIPLLMALVMILFGSANPILYCILSLVIFALLVSVVSGLLWGKIKHKSFYIPIIIVSVLCISVPITHTICNNYTETIPTVGESSDLLMTYSPYVAGNKVATLDEASTLTITEDIPRLNGATAMYPIYSAFAKAVYPKYTIDHITYANDYHAEFNYLSCNKTTAAYEMIVTGDADIIFVGGPSEEQEAFAKENGVELVYTPIGKEAFVFFANSQNPIENITVEDIKGIYSGEIRRWSELGVNGLGKIRAFQRDEGSGSQTALQTLMGDTELMKPPKENVVSGMGGIIEMTADYKNYRNAIGYSFRFYSTEMVKNDQIKLLSINGVYPSIENIENGTYPIASEFFAVTRSDADENTKAMIEWILSPQGQELIEKTGYTPLY